MTREEGPPHRPAPPQTVDSDDEDPNSPSDGYFSNSSHVPSNLLVQDSESQTSSKAREAESESQSPVGYRQSEPELSYPTRNRTITYTPTSSSRSEDSFTETSPLLEEPPPMYEDAMAGRPHPDVRATTRTGYGSTNISNVGSTPFVSGQPRPPQSMADHPQNDVYDEESASVEQSQQTRRGCFSRRKRNLEDPNRHNDGAAPSNPPELAEPVAPKIPQKPVAPTLSIPSSPSSSPTSSETSWFPTPTSSSIASPLPERPPTNPPGASFPPRKIQVHETSSSVTGTFPLYDLLDISTTSGSISIHIDPKPAPSGAPNTPAELLISTQSGSVSIHGFSGAGQRKRLSGWERWWNYGFNAVPPSNAETGIPSRPYKITITTGSGSISGVIIHGVETTIESVHSGSISLQLYPVYYGDEKNSTLTTVTHSGSTNVNILESYENNKLDRLNSRHEVRGSGSINVKYPNQWEGEVDLTSRGSGSIMAYGRELNVIRYGRGHVVGKKGEGDGGSRAQLVAYGSGSQGFYVG
ncbi:MAG: hypothetical protein Q9160_005917 [Pyrenula sp. 1 TL-2023]